MIQICVKCTEKMLCPNCDKCKPSIELLKELSKANEEYGKLYEKFELTHKFITKIICDWECDPNHAEAILSELKRMDK